MQLGSRIRQLRQRTGLSQTEVAEKAGMRPAGLCRIESPDSNPTYQTMRKVAEAIGVPLAQFFMEEEICEALRGLLHKEENERAR